MLEWSVEEFPGGNLHIGRMNGETYAMIAETLNGTAAYQFKGLQGADLNSDYAKRGSNIETVKKICEGMMSAWRHKAN